MDSQLYLPPGRFTPFVPTHGRVRQDAPRGPQKTLREEQQGTGVLTTLLMRHPIMGRVLHAADLKLGSLNLKPGSLKTIMGPPVTGNGESRQQRVRQQQWCFRTNALPLGMFP